MSAKLFVTGFTAGYKCHGLVFRFGECFELKKFVSQLSALIFNKPSVCGGVVHC